VAQPSEAWICPAAPLLDKNEPSHVGSVNSPWYESNPAATRMFQPFLSNPDPGMPEPKLRATSYSFNAWLVFASPVFRFDSQEPGLFFGAESQLPSPALTPVLGDSGLFFYSNPRANDGPPFNLSEPATAIVGGGYNGMKPFLIARHGSRPSPPPGLWPPSQRLPGAINVSFFDGHAQLVPLENLWQLYWHKDYQPPAKRPGLQ